MTKKNQLKSEILNVLFDLDIAGYLKEEIERNLDYFHYYKLKNIYKNMDFLKDYLIFLDHKNTKQLLQLDYNYPEDVELKTHDLAYYISDQWLLSISEQKLKQKIWQNDFDLKSMMLGIKGFLLLTMDEFCNATPVRLSINKVLRDREIALSKIV